MDTPNLDALPDALTSRHLSRHYATSGTSTVRML
jgi:hypothetical protein